MIEYDAIANQIRACTACFFRNPHISQLAPVNVKPPLAIMFIGENPSWEEGQQVPFDDATTSGQSLQVNFLQPLGLSRDEVWITDLFKCRYPKDVHHNKQQAEDRIRREVVGACKRWLIEEIRYARPKIVVTLSDRQVYQRMRNAFSLATPARFARAAGRCHQVELGGISVTLFPMVHPDVASPIGQGDARKVRTREKWAPIHRAEHLPALADLLRQS